MKCESEGCTAEATHAPKVHVPSARMTLAHGTVNVLLNVHRCLEHCRCFPGREQFFDQNTRDCWRAMFDDIAGDIALDYDRTFIEAIALGSMEYIAFERIGQTVN